MANPRLRARRRRKPRKPWWSRLPSLRPGGDFEVAVRAAQEALHNRLLDKYRDLFQEVYERHNPREAETRIRRAVAEVLSPENVVGRASRHRRRARRSSRQQTRSR